MPGQRHKVSRAVSVTAPTAPVRGFFWPRPWTKPGAQGRIAERGRARPAIMPRTAYVLVSGMSLG
jgi:hypothetical protein